MQQHVQQATNFLGIIALMYHRIDEATTDPWGICVSPVNFKEHIRFLKKNFKIISPQEIITAITMGNINETCICITFDDGYSDNYIHAKPILEEFDCPATFFIATAFTNQTVPFWWDELAAILLHSKKLNAKESLEVAGKKYEYIFGTNELSATEWLQHLTWRWYEEPPTSRCKAYIDIWEKLKALSFEEIKTQMGAIRKWAEADTNAHDYTHLLPMNEYQVQELSKNNLFTIGMHTHTHPDLELQEKSFQKNDIEFCKKSLCYKYGIESKCLAYPYGRFNNDTLNVAEELEISSCFTTEGAIINAASNVAMLGRYQVFNWDSAHFENQLNTWSNRLQRAL